MNRDNKKDRLNLDSFLIFLLHEIIRFFMTWRKHIFLCPRAELRRKPAKLASIFFTRICNEVCLRDTGYKINTYFLEDNREQRRQDESSLCEIATSLLIVRCLIFFPPYWRTQQKIILGDCNARHNFLAKLL